MPWDLVADAYTSELLEQFELYSRDALKLAELPEQPYLVDVAAGPGTLSILGARDGARVEAVDFSPQMVENFKRRLATENVPNINVTVGDGQALPFADDTFDGAFSMFGLIFFPDRARGFSELRRVLKPGKRAVVSSWAPMEGVLSLLFECIRETLPDLPFGANKAPLGDPAEFKQEMLAAGFSQAIVHEIVHTQIIPSVAELWGSLTRTMAPLVLLSKKLGEPRWSEVAKAIYTKLESAHGPGQVEFVGRAYLGVGVK